MKLNFLSLIVLLTLTFIACNEPRDLVSYPLENIGAVIKIPGSFKSVNQKEINRLMDKDSDLKLKRELVKFCILNPGVALLIDTLSTRKYIMLSKINPHFKIDFTSLYFLIDHERNLSSSKLNINDSTFYVGSKMGNIGSFKFIESKHQKTSGGKTLSAYSFIISSDIKTIGIGFYGLEASDAHQFISSIKKR